MKKTTLLVALLLGAISFGQTTVFSDDFNRPMVSSPTVFYSTSAYLNNKTLSTNTTPAKAQTTTMMPAGSSGGSAAVTLPNEALNLLQGSTTPTELGAVFTSAPLTSFGTAFNATLGDNTGIVTWTINLKTNRGTATGSGLSGFANDGTGVTNYGMAVVLAASESNFMNGTGYALCFNQLSASETNIVSLRKFATGVNTSSTTTTSMTPFINEVTGTGAPKTLANRYNFASAKVEYNPQTNEWSLFLRDDGLTAWSDPTVDPATGYKQIGVTTVDNTYTEAANTHFGYFFKHGVSNVNQNQAFFDNFKVVVGPVLSSESFELSNLEMYPNPTKRNFTISNKFAISNVTITNLLGQKVKEVNFDNETLNTTINIEDLQASTYLVKVTSEGKSKTIKLVKN
jgi:hypothetical protein